MRSGMGGSEGSYSESEEEDAHQQYDDNAGEFDGEEDTPPSRGEGSQSFTSTDDESNGRLGVISCSDVRHVNGSLI